ncbi:Transcription factor spt20, partial [Tulasnella sp. 427]
MTVYNPSRRDEQLLADYSDSPPSFTVKFFPEHWLINNSRPNLYHTPISFLLDDIRQRRIPPDWLQSFDQHGVTFYDVELEDHRDGAEKASKERIVLPMDAESLWADILLERERSGKITTEEEALDLESRLLAATSPPLCLDPDPIVSRIANTALRAGALETPTAFRKKDAAAENERGNAIKARQAKIMSLMNPHAAQPRLPRAPLFDVIQRKRAQPQPLAPHAPQHAPFQNPDPHATSMQAQAQQQQPLQEPTAETPTSAQNSQAARKKLILKQGSKTEELPMQSATPEAIAEASQMPGSAQIKRKASLTAPTPPPPQQKKKPNGIKPSPSVEATPVSAHSQLPVVPPQPPQPVAYQLPPSTSAAIPFGANGKPKPQNTLAKKSSQPQLPQVKKEPQMGRPMMMPGQGQAGMHPGQIPATGANVGQTPSQQHAALPAQVQVNQNQSKPSTPAP